MTFNISDRSLEMGIEGLFHLFGKPARGQTAFAAQLPRIVEP